MSRRWFGASTNVRGFTPAIDVRSDESHIRFELDVPGVHLQDLRIQYEKGVLRIDGERRFVAAEGREQVLLGRAYGRFSQEISVPDWADVDRLTARLDSGVLTIELPKRDSRRVIPVLTGHSATKMLGPGKSDDE